MSMIFQSYALWPHMTVAENIVYGLKLRKIDRATIKKKLDEILATTRLAPLAQRYPGELSGGQQQRVALARALIVEPGDAAARRAAVQSRRQSARGDALRGAPPARRVPLHHGLRHPRPVRGDDHGRRDLRDEPGQDRAGRLAGGDLRPAALGVRRALHRHEQCVQGQGARRQPRRRLPACRCASPASRCSRTARPRCRSASIRSSFWPTEPAAKDNVVPATVIRQVFLGSSRDYMVEAADGTQLRIVTEADESVATGSHGVAAAAAGTLPGAGRISRGRSRRTVAGISKEGNDDGADIFPTRCAQGFERAGAGASCGAAFAPPRRRRPRSRRS